MQEIKKNINTSASLNSKITQKVFIQTFRKVPIFQFIDILASLLILCISYTIIESWHYTNILSYRSILGLILFTFFIFVFLPRFSFFVNKKRALKLYGKEHVLVITKNGWQINQRFISWKNKKIVKYDFGIAVLNFNNVLLLLQKDSFTDEEYQLLETWIQN
ncbi:MAG: hypothetical protein Q4C73_08455 [Eubacteriales bacterium]|nr:hypothetical protein [Eubacteriales bacterium]